MEYNTQQKKLPLPEYGRSVQRMVDYAMTIDDRDERQLCAETIIDIMAGMTNTSTSVQENMNRLWEHLFIMSDYKLDIDYPIELAAKEDKLSRAEMLKYQKGSIMYRHHGRHIQRMIQQAADTEDTEERLQLLELIANQMKHNLTIWSNGAIEDVQVFKDIENLSRGKISLNADDMVLNDVSIDAPPATGNNRKRYKNK